ncbi:hypothetical protein SAMN05660862_3314, partial [Sphingobacterium psychroaquaticum]
MTFEEFFVKKKIDLSLLQQRDETLYAEFQSHYAQMGEKSFDHSKKFWFNRLRKDFLLVDTVPKEVKPTIVVQEQPVAAVKGADAEVSVPTKAVGFKPRFKAATTKTVESAPVEEPSKEENSAVEAKPTTSAPAGFKPRFKAGVTKAAETDTSNSSV